MASLLPPVPLQISQLATGVPQATDLTPATDTQDFTQAATGTTKKYIRSDEFDFYFNAVGIKTVGAVFVATTTPLLTTYNNGTAGVGATLTNDSGMFGLLIIDGVNVTMGQRILVWQQTNSAQNGIYTVTNTGTLTTNWVLTRATDYDNSAQVKQFQIVLVQQGNTLAGISFQETASGPFVIGTSPIMFVQFDILTSAIITQPLWISISAASETLIAGFNYIANFTGLATTFTLPVIAATGTVTQIAQGTSSSWILAQNSGQNVNLGDISSTVGATGSWTSTFTGASISLVCTVANTTWTAFASVGSMTYI